MTGLLFTGLLYIDIAASVHDAGDDWKLKGKPVENFIGTVEAGYSVGRFTFFLSHKSSVQAKDRGLNEVGIKYRLITW